MSKIYTVNSEYFVIYLLLQKIQEDNLFAIFHEITIHNQTYLSVFQQSL